MKMNKTTIAKLIFVTIILIGFTNCGSSGGDGDGGGNPNPDVPDPSAATLVFPANNTECNTGVVDPNNENLSTVTFQWNASANTDNYTLTVTNLNTNAASTANSNTTSVDLKIERGVPFSWKITSRAQGTNATAESSQFNFYNEGPGIENHAPFPAQALFPERGATIAATSSVNLSWTANDLDDDITENVVLFGTTAADLSNIGSVTNTQLENVSVSSGTNYFWRVQTFDAAGNSSTSELFNFRVE